MTATAEEIAKALVDELMFEKEVWPLRATNLIAQAITKAENDKLEAVARFFETGGDEEWLVYPKEIARNVRSLKFGTDILLERSFGDDAPRSLKKD